MSISDHPTALLTNQRPGPDKTRRIASALLMLAGLAVIVFPVATEVYGSFVQYRLNQSWQRQLARQEKRAALAESKQVSRFGDRAVATEESVLKQAAGPVGKTDGGFPATRIKIPKINVEQVILEGVEPEVLKNGPGHYVGTPNPGQRGNIGIAGHRVTYTAPFNRLDELDPGDAVLLETLDTIYEYRVVSKQTLDPDDLTALRPTKDARVTLTTCTPKYSARYRLDVQSALVRITPRQRPTFLRRLVGQIAKPQEKKLPRNILELALRRGQTAVAEQPQSADARTYLGMIYRNIGRFADAESQLRKAIELDANAPSAHYQLGLVMIKTGRPADAIEEFKTAVDRSPDFEPAYFRLGMTYLDSGRADQAIETFKRALVINPLSGDTHYFLGTAYERQGQDDLAKTEYEETIKFVPDFEEAKAALRRLNRRL